MAKKIYFVSRGNSIGPYSDYHVIPFRTREEAEEYGFEMFEGNFTVWYIEDSEAVAD